MREARGKDPSRGSQTRLPTVEPRHRDIRPHHRTPAHGSQKHRPLRLTITRRRLFPVSGYGQTLAGQQRAFNVRIRGADTIKWLDLRSHTAPPIEDYRT